VTDSELVVHETLDAAVRRLQVRHALHGMAGGAVVAACLSGLVILQGRGVFAAASAGGLAAVVVLCGYLWRTQRRRERARVAIELENRRPELRNLLITAEELLRNPHRTRAWIRHRVFDDAARSLSNGPRIPERRLTGSLIAAGAAVVMWIAALAGVHRPALEAIPDRVAVAPMRLSGDVMVQATVTPPAYAGADVRKLTNPERIEVLEGSRLQLVVSPADAHLRIRLGSSELPAIRQGARSTIDTLVTTSGYVAIVSGAGSSATSRLIPVAVTADRVPSVKVESPGRDLLLADAAQRIPIRATAADDLGLRALELRYTKVSGTGEQFEFVEGSIPVTINRRSGTEWAGASEIALGALGLDTGDSLVYRVVARDARPGNDGLGSSDTYVVEIAGPGQTTLAGMDMPPDQDRYALSQQMIVLKIERLRLREKRMARDALQAEFENLAAEQRAVRANFIFLMGGHVEDEEEEAEQSHEIQEGRLENRGRRDISAAVRHMTIAERGLAAFSTAASLPPARAAVEALQRAFGRSRYILRAMPVRSRIDRSRRLSGELRAASGWLRDADPGPERTAPSRARALLGRLRQLTSAGGQADRSALTGLAEEALAVEPGSVEWQEVAARLTRGETAAAMALLRDQAQQDVLPQSDRLTRPSRLRSAWMDSRR
jgi:hypothetical protein